MIVQHGISAKNIAAQIKFPLSVKSQLCTLLSDIIRLFIPIKIFTLSLLEEDKLAVDIQLNKLASTMK
jgi:hypothetical protein